MEKKVLLSSSRWMMMRWCCSIPRPCWKISATPCWRRAPARSALEIIRREDNIDLVITDQAMPHMTGSDLAAAIRAEKPDLPIILATGFAELPPGADEGLPKLSKPFLQHQLADAIAKTVAV